MNAARVILLNYESGVPLSTAFTNPKKLFNLVCLDFISEPKVSLVDFSPECAKQISVQGDFDLAFDRFCSFCQAFFGHRFATALHLFQVDLRALHALQVETFSSPRLVLLFEHCFQSMQSHMHAIGAAGAPEYCVDTENFFAHFFRISINSPAAVRLQGQVVNEMGAELAAFRAASKLGGTRPSKRPRESSHQAYTSPQPPPLLGRPPCWRWAAHLIPCKGTKVCKYSKPHIWSAEDTVDTSHRPAFQAWVKKKFP
jgi:hypothetical protein